MDNNNSTDDTMMLGDVVEHRMNTNVFGVIIGFEGTLVSVRLSPSLAIVKFHEFELQTLGDDEYVPPVEDEGDNVVDFTKERALRADTKTEGAA